MAVKLAKCLALIKKVIDMARKSPLLYSQSFVQTGRNSDALHMKKMNTSYQKANSTVSSSILQVLLTVHGPAINSKTEKVEWTSPDVHV